jgi:hypothetical protein
VDFVELCTDFCNLGVLLACNVNIVTNASENLSRDNLYTLILFCVTPFSRVTLETKSNGVLPALFGVSRTDLVFFYLFLSDRTGTTERGFGDPSKYWSRIASHVGETLVRKLT